MRSIGVLFVAGSALVGCVDDRSLWREDLDQTRVVTVTFAQQATRAIDFLYVVDNSALMMGHEARVTAAFDMLGRVIHGGQSRWNDIHVGIVTSDVDCTDDEPVVIGDGNNVAWRTDPAMTSDRFIVDWRHLDGTVTTNVGTGATLGEVLARMGSAGHAGCGVSRPFEAARRALRDRRFHRDDTDLVLGMVTAADEHSAISPATLADEIRAGMAPDRFSLLGLSAPSTGRSHDRFSDLAALFPNRSTVSPLDGVGDAFTIGFAGWWGESLPNPCFEGALLDTDETTPGLQPSCAVHDEVHVTRTSAPIQERVLPACDGSNAPCWRIDRDQVNCQLAPDQRRLVIDRLDFPPEGTVTVAQCEGISI